MNTNTDAAAPQNTAATGSQNTAGVAPQQAGAASDPALAAAAGGPSAATAAFSGTYAYTAPGAYQHPPSPAQATAVFSQYQHPLSPAAAFSGPNQHPPSPYASAAQAPAFSPYQHPPSPYSSAATAAFSPYQHPPSPYSSAATAAFSPYQYPPSPYSSVAAAAFSQYQYPPSPYSSAATAPTAHGAYQHPASPYSSPAPRSFLAPGDLELLSPQQRAAMEVTERASVRASEASMRSVQASSEDSRHALGLAYGLASNLLSSQEYSSGSGRPPLPRQRASGTSASGTSGEVAGRDGASQPCAPRPPLPRQGQGSTHASGTSASGTSGEVAGGEGASQPCAPRPPLPRQGSTRASGTSASGTSGEVAGREGASQPYAPCPPPLLRQSGHKRQRSDEVEDNTKEPASQPCAPRPPLLRQSGHKRQRSNEVEGNTKEPANKLQKVVCPTRRRILLVGGSADENFCLIQPADNGDLMALDNWKKPREAAGIQDLGSLVASLDCSAISTALVTQDGKGYTAGSDSKGVLGRLMRRDLSQDQDDPYDGDEYGYEREQASITQVTGFFPKNNEKRFAADDCILKKVTGGNSHHLWLASSGNVYFSGVLEDGKSNQFAFDKEQGVVRVFNTNTDEGCNRTPFCIYFCGGRTASGEEFDTVEGAVPAVDIASGENFGTITLQDGTQLSFGFGNDGELARAGTKTLPFQRVDFQVTVNLQDKTEHAYVPSAVASAPTHMYYPYHERVAIYDNNGQRIDGVNTDRVDLARVAVSHMTPAPMSSGSPPRVKKFAHGKFHSLAIDNEGRIFCIGIGDQGQLGLGIDFDGMVSKQGLLTGRDNLPFAIDHWVRIPFFDSKPVKDVACVQYASLVLLEDGTLWAFGMGDFTGLNTRESVFEPRLVPIEKKLVSIDSGPHSFMVVADDLTLFTFGTGPAVRKLPKGTPLPTPRPLDLNRVLNGEHIVNFFATKAGASHCVYVVDVERDGVPEVPAANSNEENQQPPFSWLEPVSTLPPADYPMASLQFSVSNMIVSNNASNDGIVLFIAFKILAHALKRGNCARPGVIPSKTRLDHFLSNIVHIGHFLHDMDSTATNTLYTNSLKKCGVSGTTRFGVRGFGSVKTVLRDLTESMLKALYLKLKQLQEQGRVSVHSRAEMESIVITTFAEGKADHVQVADQGLWEKWARILSGRLWEMHQM